MVESGTEPRVKTPGGLFGRRQKLSTLGIDIGAHSIKLVQVGPHEGRDAVYNFGRVPTPPGAFEDNEPVDLDALAGAIAELLDRHNIRQRERVVTAIGSQRAILRQATFPRMSDEEFREALKWEAENYLPIPIDEAAVDFQRLVNQDRGRNEEGPGRMSVFLVASYRELVERYRALCDACNLELDVVEVDCLAQGRALEYLGYAEEEGPQSSVVIVDIGDEATRAVLYRDGVFTVARYIPLGGRYLAHTLRDRLRVRQEEAEALMVSHGLFSEERADVSELLTEALDRVYNEILRLLRRLLLQDTRREPAAIVFVGGGARLKGFREFIEQRHRAVEEYELQVELLKVVDPAENANLAPWLEHNRAYFTPEYTAALGMALRKEL